MLDMGDYESLTDPERLLLLEVAANPVLKKLINNKIHDVKEAILSLDSNSTNFTKDYRTYQINLAQLESFKEVSVRILADAQAHHPILVTEAQEK